MMKKITALLSGTLLALSVSISCFAQTYHKTDQGVSVTVNKLHIDVQFYSNNIVRVVKYPIGKTLHIKSFTVIMKPEKVQFEIKKLGNVLNVTDKSLTIKLNLTDGQVVFNNPSGKELLAEKKGGTHFLPCKDPLEHAFDVKQSFHLTPEEVIYGLGQHQRGMLNHRNQTFLLKQRNRQVAIPYFYSTQGYGLFWDNTSTTIFKDTTGDTFFDSTVGTCVDYYFLKSNNANQGLKRWDELTGKAPMFPRWAFGYWQSREHYRTQKQLLGVVRKYRSLKVPLDVIVQDWQYWGTNEHWNSTKFVHTRYPHPKEMISQVHKMHAHIVISVWPSFGPATQIYDEMEKHHFLYNKLTTWPPKTDDRVYDAFNPKARDIYWDFMDRNLFSIGIDGWWLDSTEPDQFSPDNDIMTHDGLFGKVRNAFPMEHVGGVYLHQRRTTSKKRVVILARSAWAGQQRYGSIIWSGDTQSSWKALHEQIADGLNMAISGIPYWTCDIGGFFSGGHYPRGVKDPAFQELYVRWLEFGTFCPIMRSHGTNTPREIYQFGEKGHWAYDALARFINLRYRLMPYIYSDSWLVTSQAYTPMRALVMDFPNDQKVYNINNEYMFGQAFLVRPITQSLYTRRINRDTSTTNFSMVKKVNVYLPKGSEWYDFWTAKKLAGGEEVASKAPINQIPLYVKAGSVVPMGPFEQYATQKINSPIEVRIYPGADGLFTLYNDQNNNYNYDKGDYSLISFKWNNATKTLTIGKRKGKYPGMEKDRTFKIVIVHGKTGAGMKETPNVQARIVRYNGMKKVIRF